MAVSEKTARKRRFGKVMRGVNRGEENIAMGLLADIPTWVPPILNLVLLLAGAFLILLVLIQKGKGGGLAGAFGGSGGSSAFGSRAGDTFTRITIYVAAVWLLLIMITIKCVQDPRPLDERRELEPAPTQVPVDE